MAQNIHNIQHRTFDDITYVRTYYNAGLHHGHARIQKHKNRNHSKTISSHGQSIRTPVNNLRIDNVLRFHISCFMLRCECRQLRQTGRTNVSGASKTGEFTLERTLAAISLSEREITTAGGCGCCWLGARMMLAGSQNAASPPSLTCPLYEWAKTLPMYEWDTF